MIKELIHVVKGVVVEDEAYDGAKIGDVEWQFSDGPPGKRNHSSDYISLEEGIKDHPNAIFIFYL